MTPLALALVLAAAPCDGDAPLTPCEAALLERVELEHRDALVSLARLEGCRARLAARTPTVAAALAPRPLVEPEAGDAPEVPAWAVGALAGALGALAGLVAGALLAR